MVLRLLQEEGEGLALSVAQVEALALAQGLGVPLLHCVTVELPLVVLLLVPHTLSVGDCVALTLALWHSVLLALSVVLRV